MDPHLEILKSIGMVVSTLIGVAAIFALLTKPLKEKLTGLVNDSMTRELCNERHDRIQDDLEKGDGHFRVLDTKIDGVKSDTANLTGKIDLLLAKNGVHKP